MNREEHGDARAGMLTGSRAQKIMAGGWRAWNSVAKEMRDPRPFYSVEDTPGMPTALAWGQLSEPAACANFWERHPEYEVCDPKFIRWHNPEQKQLYQLLAYSPDRMLARDGKHVAVLEAKCPYNSEMHVATITGGTLPLWCKWQTLHGMRVAGVDHAWFVSYDPRLIDEDFHYFEFLVRAEDYRVDMLRMARTIAEFLDGFTTGEPFLPKHRRAADYQTMF